MAPFKGGLYSGLRERLYSRLGFRVRLAAGTSESPPGLKGLGSINSIKRVIWESGLGSKLLYGAI